MRRKLSTIILLLAMIITASCEWDDVDKIKKQNNPAANSNTSYSDSIPVMKVAVVLPLDNSYAPRFERVSEWALQNIVEATRNLSFGVAPADPSGIKIEIEWYDENIIDAQSCASELASRSDISAILGPMFSSDAQEFALECAKTGKNILLPCTTSSEVVRKFSGKPWFWSFAETDIRQCQVMLETAKDHLHCNSVSLITSTSFYGQTFLNWLPFQAKEQGLSLNHIYLYDDVLDQATLDKAMSQSIDGQALFCTPSEVSDVLTFQNAVRTQKPKGYTIVSDIAMDPSLLDYGNLVEDVLGIGITADSKSGFLDEYAQKFSQEPTEGECQFYDALVLMALVASDLYNQGLADSETETIKHQSEPYFYNHKVSDALARILEPGDIDELFLTKVEDIKSIIQTQLYNVRGASGHIDFDKQNRSSVAHSTYQLWTIKNRAFNTLKLYYETPMSTDAWESEVLKIDDIPTADVNIQYPGLSDNWAILVAGSNTWTDYRHQANVLMVYHMLKTQGYPDDRIILIMEDNLAHNPQNTQPGIIKDYNGNIINRDVQVDYKPSELESQDIARIIMGQKTDKLKKVIEATANDNILIYWTGNGTDNELTLGSKAFTYSDFSSVMQQMSQNQRKCRKILCVSDASHAQAVTNISPTQNITGVLCINSASTQETSLADQCDFDEVQATYLATHFTKVFVEELSKDPSVTYYDLYTKLARFTSGSHVNISNVQNFDNLKKANISEFIQYKRH